MKFQTVCFVIFVTAGFAAAADNFTFPDGFLLGAATASYQIEGGWDAGGKAKFNTIVHSIIIFTTRFNIQKVYILLKQCIHVFCTYLRAVITSIYSIK